MEGFEEKLGAILENPEMMQKIMGLAQTLGQNDFQPPAPSQPVKQEKPPAKNMPSIPDLAMVQKIASLTQQTGIDKNQQNLLKALRPYLGNDRINKLEKAMRAARIAGFAATALGGSNQVHNSR